MTDEPEAEALPLAAASAAFGGAGDPRALLTDAPVSAPPVAAAVSRFTSVSGNCGQSVLTQGLGRAVGLSPSLDDDARDIAFGRTPDAEDEANLSPIAAGASLRSHASSSIGAPEVRLHAPASAGDARFVALLAGSVSRDEVSDFG